MYLSAVLMAVSVIWFLMGPPGPAFLAILGLSLIGAIFYYAAAGQIRRSLAMVLSLLCSAVVLFTVASIGVGAWLLLDKLGILPHGDDLERNGWLGFIAIGILSNTAAVAAFGWTFWYQISRQAKKTPATQTRENIPPTSPTAEPSAQSEQAPVATNRLTPVRVIAGFLLCACVAGIGYVYYLISPPFHSTELLIDRCMNAYEPSTINGAEAELKRRGPKTIPAIAEALQSVPSQIEIGFNPRHPDPRYLFDVLAYFGTEPAMRLLHDWAANRNRAPIYRFYAFQALLDAKDYSAVGLIDDLLRDDSDAGRKALQWFLFTTSNSDNPDLVAAAIPYLRIEVENPYAPGNIGMDQVVEYAPLLKRVGTPEAMDLLVRMARRNEKTRQQVEQKVGADFLAELMKE